MSIFDELETSLQEAVEIKQGKAQASRITCHEVADVKSYSRPAKRLSDRICQRHGNKCGHHQKLGDQAPQSNGIGG